MITEKMFTSLKLFNKLFYDIFKTVSTFRMTFHWFNVNKF